MRKPIPALFTLLFSILSFQITEAQLAIIKDPDGFCNVRSGEGNQSSIDDTLSNGHIVFAFVEDASNNWLPVDYYKGKVHSSGYVHRSRLLFIQDMPTFKNTVAQDTLVKLELNDMQLTLKAGKFVGAGRKFTYEKPKDAAEYLKTIDGKQPWGTDGGLPRNEYRAIQLRQGANTLNFPKSQFNDLFEPTPLSGTLANFDKATNTIYLHSMNSDGAGGYCVVWIIRNAKIVHRAVFYPF